MRGTKALLAAIGFHSLEKEKYYGGQWVPATIPLTYMAIQDIILRNIFFYVKHMVTEFFPLNYPFKLLSAWVQIVIFNPSHLSAGEDEDESGSSCGEAPGEQGPQQGLKHRTDACNHGARSNQTHRDRGRSLFLPQTGVWTKSCLSRISANTAALQIKTSTFTYHYVYLQVQLNASLTDIVYNYCPFKP